MTYDHIKAAVIQSTNANLYSDDEIKAISEYVEKCENENLPFADFMKSSETLRLIFTPKAKKYLLESMTKE